MKSSQKTIKEVQVGLYFQFGSMALSSRSRPASKGKQYDAFPFRGKGHLTAAGLKWIADHTTELASTSAPGSLRHR